MHDNWTNQLKEGGRGGEGGRKKEHKGGGRKTHLSRELLLETKNSSAANCEKRVRRGRPFRETRLGKSDVETKEKTQQECSSGNGRKHKTIIKTWHKHQMAWFGRGNTSPELTSGQEKEKKGHGLDEGENHIHWIT